MTAPYTMFKPSSDPHYYPGYDYDPEGDVEDPELEDLRNAWIVGDGFPLRKPHIQRGADEGPAHPDAPLNNTERWMQNMGHAFTRRIHESEPTTEPLYRGMTVPHDAVAQARATGSIKLPLSPFDEDSETAAQYALPDPQTGRQPGANVLLRLAPGAKSLPILDSEHISHGDFDVTDMRQMTPQEHREWGSGYGPPPMLMDIKHRSVPHPDHPERTASWRLRGVQAWRLAATPQKIYRGLQVDLPEELHKQVHQWNRPAMDESEVGQHLNIGPALLNHLQNNHPLKNHWNNPRDLALGSHWTTSKSMAETAARQGGAGGKGQHAIVLEADHPGDEYLDPERTGTGGTWASEEEHTLHPGTPLNVTSVNWNGNEVLHDPHYEKSMPEDYGRAYTGGPRQHTAGTYYHYTDNPNFKPDPKMKPWDHFESPTNNASGRPDRATPGLYVHPDPSRWEKIDDINGGRRHQVELEGPEAQDEGDDRGAFIPGDQLHQYKVKGITPNQHWQNEHSEEAQRRKWLEQNPHLAAKPDWELALIRKNKARDINDQEHSLDWGGSKGYAHGEQSSGLAPSCSCGWSTDAGSESAGRRRFTDHIRSIQRTAAADQDYGLPPNMEFRKFDKPGMYGLNAAGIWHKNKPTGGGNWVSAITWRNGEIGNVETKERHKGNGYAGMLYNWVKDNHEPNLAHSRSLTPEGRAWAEKVGAWRLQGTRAHFGMPMADWTPKIEFEGGDHGGQYTIPHPTDPYDDPVGSLSWRRLKDPETEEPFIGIGYIETHDDYRKQDVARALMHRLHNDYPHLKIAPGSMSDEGQAFKDKMVQHHPDASGLLIGRVAMPTYYHYTDDPNFTLKNQSPRDVEGGGDAAGLFVSPEGQGGYWPKQWGGARSHMVEMHSPHNLEDHPDVINRHFLHPREKITPELFVPHGKGDLEVTGVYPYDEWDEEDFTHRHAAVDPMSENIPAHPDYYYHGTSHWNAQDIQDEGQLHPHGADYGTEQEAWPDASTEERSYWHHDPQVVKSFYPEEGHPTLLRAPRKVAPFKTESTGDTYSTQPVSAENLEAYSGGGNWTPLSQWSHS